MKRYTAKDVVALALAEVGYHEKNSDANLDLKTAPNDGNGNHTKYGRDLYAAGYYNGNKCGYDWCDQFHDWLHWMASGKDAAYAQEVICQSGPLGAGCKWSAGYYKNAGRWYSKPEIGDQPFFNDYAHTGVVTSVSATHFTTAEGNVNNMVVTRTYAINDPCVDGFGRPRYASEEEVNPAPTPAPADPVLETIKAYFSNLNDNDCASWSTQAREWAIANGLILGIGSMKDGTPNYAWEAPITREQLVTILYRYAGLIGKQ